MQNTYRLVGEKAIHEITKRRMRKKLAIAIKFVYFTFVIELLQMNKFTWNRTILTLNNGFFIKILFIRMASSHSSVSYSGTIHSTPCPVDHPTDSVCISNEPSHEIMALFVLRKLILQVRMRSHLVGLDVWCLVGPFVYFRASCVRTAKVLARRRRCANSPEPSLSLSVLWSMCSFDAYT